MANNIDQRVVQMQFDNAQFEQGVKTSTQSLDNLKNSLNFDGATNSVNKLSNTLDTTLLNKNVDQTASAFERLRSHVPTALSTAGAAMLKFGKLSAGVLTGVATGISGLAIKGGITRAMNLKQANFMLRGLLGDTEKGQRAVARIMDDVQESVDGTAYSLDQAAIVASQFAATGMRGGDKMLGALRGVAGVAAMTGAEYSRVGEIFTQVSGQGRLMGNDLLQLSGYGMNAAATLTDYFNDVNSGAVTASDSVKKAVKDATHGAKISEGELRDFVSKGKVSFEVFAAAMDNAFGEHATKANETFSGALANMKSALSRIGEKVASPAIDALRDIFNALRPLINALNAQLTPSLEKLGEKIKSIGDTTVKYLEGLGGSGKVSVNDILDLDFDAVSPLTKYLNEVKKGRIEASDEVVKLANSFKKSKDITNSDTKALIKNQKISFDALKSALNEEDKTIKATLYDLDRFSTKEKDASKTLADFFNNVNKGSVKTSENIKNLVKELSDGKKVSVKDIKELAKEGKISYELLGTALGKNIWENPRNDLSTFSILVRSFINIGWALKAVIDNIKSAFKDVFPKTTVENIRDIAQNFYAFTGAFMGFSSDLNPTLSNIRNIFRGLFSVVDILIRSFGVLIKLMSPVFKALGSVASLIIAVLGRIGNAIYTIDQSINSFTALGSAFDYILSIGTALQKMFSSIVGSVTDVISVSVGIKDLTEATQGKGEAVANALNKMGDGFKSIGSKISEFIHGIDFEFINKILTGGILYKLGIALSKFINFLTKASFSTASFGIGPIFDNLRQTLILYQNQLKADLLIKQAKAIAIFVGSLLVLSMIDTKKLASGVAAIGALLAMMNKSLSYLLTITSKKGLKDTAGLSLLANAFIKLGIGIAILSLALKTISKLSLKEIGKGLLGITGLCTIILGATIALSKLGGKTIRGSGSILIFALAISALTPALKELGSMKMEEIGHGLLALSFSLAAMVLAFGAISGIKGGTKAAVSILIISEAIKALAPAFNDLGSMNMEEIGHGLLALSSGLASMIIALGAISGIKGGTKAAVTLIILASALKEFAPVFKDLGSMKMDQIGRGLLGLSSGLAILIVALGAMSGIKGGTKAAINLLIIVSAIKSLSEVVNSFSSMKMDQIGRGLLALAGGLTILILALGAMSGMGVKGIASAAALLLVSQAVNILAPALQKLGSMSLPQIGIALLAIAGAFTVLGLAGLILGPIIPSILLLSAALLAIGVACAAAGIGISSFAVGLSTLVAMGPMAAKGIGDVFIAIAESVPEIVKSIAEAIVELIKILGENAIQIAAVGVSLIIALLSAINDRMYEIVNLGIQICVNFINGIANNLPSIIQAGMNLMISFINGMAEGIRNSQEFIFSAVGNLMGAIINFVLSFLQILAEEVPVIGDFLSGGLEKAKQKVDEKLNPEYAKQKAKEFSEGYSSGVDESAEQAGKSGEKLADNAAKGADKSDYFKKAASKAGNVYNTDLGKAAQKAKGIGVKFPENAGKGADRVSAFQSAANKAGDKYNSALKNKARSARTAGSDLATNAKSGMDSVTGFYDVGVDGAQGFVNGASSKDTSAYNAGLSLAGQFKQAIIDKLDSHSPSRETYKLGYFGLIGFVNAVNNNLKLARNSGVGIANALLSGLKDTSREISASVDGVDLIPNQPIIKPVVDLSGVRAASDDINSMLLNTNAINATASIGNIASSNIDANFKMEALFRKLGDKIDALSESNNNLDPGEIYNAIFMGASNAQPSVRLNERELGRGLQDMGVAFR